MLHMIESCFRAAVAAMTIGLASASLVGHPGEAELFAPPESYSVGSVPVGVTVADVDGDGTADVVSANSQSGDLSLLLNSGDGTLAAEVRLDVGGGSPRLAAVGDLDGDGHADLVTAIRSGPATIAVFVAEAAGTFAPAVHYGPESFAFVLALGDLDGDTDLDVAVMQGVSVAVLRNAGDGTFGPAEVYDVFDAPIVYTSDLAAADVNGDGHVDLVAVNDCPVGCDAAIAILLNAGDGTFLPPVPLDLGIDSAGAVRAGDLDGDGDADLALVRCAFPDSDLVIAVNDGAGAFDVLSQSPTGRHCAAGSVTTPEGLAILDLDDDGAPDAVLTSMNDDGIRALLNEGDLTFGEPLAFGVGDQPVAAAAGDLDGDGRADVVTADRGIGSMPTVTVLLNTVVEACPADVDGSGTVDGVDLGLLLGAWGPCTECAADLDGSGSVDGADLGALLGAWGGCP